MGIFISGSPSDRQPWLFDHAKSTLKACLELLEEIKGVDFKEEDKAKLLVRVKGLLIKTTRLVDFAGEKNLWRGEITDFLMQKGMMGLDAYLYLLSKGDPPTYINLTRAFNEQIAQKIKQKAVILKDGHLIVKRGFQDIVFERYNVKNKFISSLTMHRSYVESFTNPEMRQEKFDILGISSPSDKDKVMRLFQFSSDFITQRISWLSFINRIEELNRI